MRTILCTGLACLLLVPAGASAKTEILLGVDRESVRAGGELRLRIDNRSATAVGYGRAYEIDRWRPGSQSWVKLDLHRLFTQELLSVAAGRVSQWEPVSIGPRWVPGRYRARKSFQRFAEGRLGPPRILSATFQVNPAPR